MNDYMNSYLSQRPEPADTMYGGEAPESIDSWAAHVARCAAMGTSVEPPF